MKTINLSHKSRRLYTIVWAVVVALVVAACDTLKEDADVITPDANVTGDEIYLPGNATSIIDLSARIQTNVPVTLAVTGQPAKGTLTSLGKGLLQYAPTQGKQATKDMFEFTVYSGNNEVIKKDTVTIIVEPDTTRLPCGVFAVDDFRYNLRPDSTITIDVLANDVICDADSADLEVSIVEGADLGPWQGTARVVANRVVYTAGGAFSGNDKFIYRVRSRRNSAISSYAVVVIGKKSNTCILTLKDDSVVFDVDSLKGDTLFVPVFANDVLCGSNMAQFAIGISRPPHHVTATISEHGITLSPAELSPGQVVVDSVGYKICRDDTCGEAFLRIRMQR